MIYVDRFPETGWGRWNGGAHMLGTDIRELHTFAQRLGLKRAWFQSKATFAHYDLTSTKRKRAVLLGAVEIELGEIPDDVLMLRPDGGYETRAARRERRGVPRRDDGGIEPIPTSPII